VGRDGVSKRSKILGTDSYLTSYSKYRGAGIGEGKFDCSNKGGKNKREVTYSCYLRGGYRPPGKDSPGGLEITGGD